MRMSHARNDPPHDTHHGHAHGHKFPAQHWERLLSDERRALLDPERLLDRVGVGAGMTVADLGAGPGFFTFPLAARVGPSGRVYATDVSRDMLEVLEQRGLPPHVHPIHAQESKFDIPDGVVDIALLGFVLHELAHATEFLGEVRRILRPDGRLVVLEWVPQEEPIGPPLHERLSEAQSETLLAAGGFQILERGHANASNYLLVTAPAQRNAHEVGEASRRT